MFSIIFYLTTSILICAIQYQIGLDEDIALPNRLESNKVYIVQNVMSTT